MEGVLDGRAGPQSAGVVSGPRARPAAVAPPEVAALVADLPHLPAQRPALLRVVQAADDPDCSLGRLADVAALDPAFAARLLQLANSAYYGRSGRVAAIGPAVSVLGAETLRGLAVTMVLGLSGESGPVPPGFWDRAATTAAAARLLAPRVGADTGDAFCVGLLREVGQALLYRASPAVYGLLLETLEDEPLAEAERAWCGTTSAQVGAAALRAVGLPEAVCAALVAQQPGGGAGSGAPLARALRGGVLLARAVSRGDVDECTTERLAAVLGGDLSVAKAAELALRVAAQAAALSTSMR